MYQLDIAYRPPGVSFEIRDSLTSAAEKHIKEAHPERSGSLNVVLEISSDGSAHNVSAGGSSLSDGLIEKVELYLTKNFDSERYVKGSQSFLTATNTVTFEQNTVPLPRHYAETLMREAVQKPSCYKYSMREVEYIFDKDTQRVIYENFRSPKSYVKWNHSETGVVLPAVCVRRAEAVRVAYEAVKDEFANFILIDATDVEKINDSFVEALASELSENMGKFSHFGGMRLRGFSGVHSRMFAKHFRWKKEGFITW